MDQKNTFSILDETVHCTGKVLPKKFVSRLSGCCRLAFQWHTEAMRCKEVLIREECFALNQSYLFICFTLDRLDLFIWTYKPSHRLTDKHSYHIFLDVSTKTYLHSSIHFWHQYWKWHIYCTDLPSSRQSFGSWPGHNVVKLFIGIYIYPHCETLKKDENQWKWCKKWGAASKHSEYSCKKRFIYRRGHKCLTENRNLGSSVQFPTVPEIFQRRIAKKSIGQLVLLG